MTKCGKIKKKAFWVSRLYMLRKKAKKNRLKAKKRAKLAALKLDRHNSEDECDFDFDNSGRALCSTSEDDSDGPQGTG